MPTVSSRTWCTPSTTEPAHTIPHLAMVVVQYLLWNERKFCSFCVEPTVTGRYRLKGHAKQEAKQRLAKQVAGGRPCGRGRHNAGGKWPACALLSRPRLSRHAAVFFFFNNNSNNTKDHYSNNNNNNNSPGHPDPKPKGLGLHVFRSHPSDALAVYFRMLSLDDCKIQMILSSHNIVILRSLTNIN